MPNIFAELPQNLEQEVFEVLASRGSTRIERIISRGHTTPQTEWYDQEQAEWVIVLQGAAVLTFEQGESLHLTPGCYVNIPAHQRHRVDWTTPEQETIWLAVHY